VASPTERGIHAGDGIEKDIIVVICVKYIEIHGTQVKGRWMDRVTKPNNQQAWHVTFLASRSFLAKEVVHAFAKKTPQSPFPL
jgi:hypothetical protein